MEKNHVKHLREVYKSKSKLEKQAEIHNRSNVTTVFEQL